jgi:hypothetical protein
VNTKLRLKDDLSTLPGADLVLRGLDDLQNGTYTEYALLVLAAGPRLRGLGFEIPEKPNPMEPYEHQLYEMLERTHGDSAYSRYNSLLRKIVSFAQAFAHASTNP